MCRHLLILVLAACNAPGANTSSDAWPGEAASTDAATPLAPPEPVMTLAGGEIGPGLSTLFTVTGAIPGSTVFLGVSPGGLGEGPCLGDACLDLAPPAFAAASTPADASGTALLVLLLPDFVEPGTVLGLQAVQRDGESTWLSPADTRVVIGVEEPIEDLDGDGYTSDVDCDDDDASVHPGALEVCDGVDTDCDPDTDEAGRVIVDSEGEFASIRDGLAAARDGGLVELCGGVWPLNDLVINRSVTLRGAGADSTTLDGGGTGGILQIYAADVTIEGFTLTGGNSDYGGAIWFDYAVGGHVLQDLKFVGNTADHGGAMYLDRTAVTVRRVEFESNSAGSNGGAIYNDGHAELVDITDSTFFFNTATYGGAIYTEGGPITLRDCVLEQNDAAAGGAIRAFSDFSPHTIKSISSDWGFGLGNDNTPDDISDGGISYASYRDDETFTCTSTGGFDPSSLSCD
jgi:predicted outer membrane repeat protein